MPLNFCLSTLSLTATSTLSSLWNPEHVLSSLSIVLYDFSSGKWCFFQMIFLSSMNHFFFFFQIFSLVYSRFIFKKNRISYPSILTILILYLQRQCLLFLSQLLLDCFTSRIPNVNPNVTILKLGVRATCTFFFFLRISIAFPDYSSDIFVLYYLLVNSLFSKF